jgi:hypothetical protein
MALTAHTYTKLAKSLVDKLADLDSDTLKVKLLSAYTVGSTQDTAQFESDVITAGVGVELTTANGYTVGGVSLSGVTFTESGHVYTLTCTNPSWASASFAASHALFLDSTPGSAATNPVICYWDFGGTITGGGGTFTLTISGTGLVTITGS